MLPNVLDPAWWHGPRLELLLCCSLLEWCYKYNHSSTERVHLCIYTLSTKGAEMHQWNKPGWPTINKHKFLIFSCLKLNFFFFMWSMLQLKIVTYCRQNFPSSFLLNFQVETLFFPVMVETRELVIDKRINKIKSGITACSFFFSSTLASL